MSAPTPVIAGVQYCRPPTPPPEEHGADLRRIRDMGFDAVRVWLSWGWHEVRPGDFRWEDTDRLFALAGENGLWVAANLQLESPPGWFHPRDPLTGPDGPVRRSHFLGTRVPCFDSAPTRRAAEPFVRAAIRRYRDHPALLAWDAWNEPHARQECLCPASRAAFSAWLAETYGDVEAFNRMQGKRFTAFDEVPMVGYGNEYSEQLHYRLWAADSVAGRLRWAADLIRQEDRSHPVTSHAGVCSVLQSMLRGTSVCAMNAKAVDFYGLSMPLRYEAPRDGRLCRVAPDQRHLAGLMLDWCRSVSDPFWVAELYSNPAGRFLDLDPGELSWQFWMAVASGAKGIYLWQFKPERFSAESPGYGLVDLDGGDTDRSRRLEEDLRILRAHRGLFEVLVPCPAGVGILYDERAHCVAEADPELNGLYRDRIQGAYRLMESAGLPVRFVPRQAITATEGLKALYLAGAGMMDETLAAGLRRFVSRGGTLIAEPGFAGRTADTWIPATNPPCGLDGLFGVRERGLTRAPEPFAFRGASGLPDGRFSGCRADLSPSGAGVTATFADGTPASTAKPHGSGTAHQLGGFPGDGSKALLRRLLADAGVRPPCDPGLPETPDLRLRLGFSGQDAVLFLFNTGPDPAVAQPNPRLARDLRILAGGERDGACLHLPANTVTIAVAPRSAIPG